MSHRFQRLFLLLSLSAGTIIVSAQAPGFKAIQPPGSDPAYSAGMLANGTLYVSGQGSSAKDFSGQMNESMHKVRAVLQGAGMDYSNIVWMNIYLTGEHNLPAMEDAYWQTIGPNPPARTVLTVAALPSGEMVEINCIAVADGREARISIPPRCRRAKFCISRRRAESPVRISLKRPNRRSKMSAPS
jgi:2-iminobutanoate/2-iminopropanoate deaminase